MSTTMTSLVVRIAGRCEAVCHTYREEGPILVVATPTTTLRLSGPGAVSTDEVAFAFSLLRAVRTYAAEVQAHSDAEAEATMVLPGTERATLLAGDHGNGGGFR